MTPNIDTYVRKVMILDTDSPYYLDEVKAILVDFGFCVMMDSTYRNELDSTCNEKSTT